MIAARDLRVLQDASGLHTLLLGPGEPRVTRARQPVIVPDDVLWELPFQTLRSAAGRFLVETAAISYAPSIAALSAATRDGRAVRAEGAVLALGNPAIAAAAGGAPETRSARLAPLPHAEREAREVARLYAGDSARAYVGTEATEHLLRQEAGRYGLLHLATHGIFNDRSPMHSHVLLARGASPDDDGLLEAWGDPVARAPRRPRRAVGLRVQERARRARRGPHRAVVGARRGRRTDHEIVSQWKVDSASTTALMLAFHRERRRGASTAQALRLAAARLRESPEYGTRSTGAGLSPSARPTDDVLRLRRSPRSPENAAGRAPVSWRASNPSAAGTGRLGRPRDVAVAYRSAPPPGGRCGTTRSPDDPCQPPGRPRSRRLAVEGDVGHIAITPAAARLGAPVPLHPWTVSHTFGPSGTHPRLLQVLQQEVPLVVVRHTDHEPIGFEGHRGRAGTVSPRARSADRAFP